MALMINYLCLYKNGQPNYLKLKKNGWVNPKFGEQLLTDSLVKDFKDIQVQIVRHQFDRGFSDRTTIKTYTEIFFHPKGDMMKIKLKGEGEYVSPEDVFECLKWLEKELS